MSESLKSFLTAAAAHLRRRIEQQRAKGIDEGDGKIMRLRLLEDLIKEQTPNEDAGSTARQAR